MAIDLERIEEAPHILDILLQTEDILDSLDVYCYKNWLDGEVIDGPVVRRHWISVSLLYPFSKMPDPRAALRLLKHDVIVEFSKVQQNGDDFQALADTVAPSNTVAPAASSDASSGVAALGSSTPNGAASINPPATPAVGADTQPAMFWMVKIAFPRRLLTQMGADLSFYDDEVDIEDVESAKDSGIDDESGYDTDEQAPAQAGEPGAMPPGMPPADPNAPPGSPPGGLPIG